MSPNAAVPASVEPYEVFGAEQTPRSANAKTKGVPSVSFQSQGGARWDLDFVVSCTHNFATLRSSSFIPLDVRRLL